MLFFFWKKATSKYTNTIICFSAVDLRDKVSFQDISLHSTNKRIDNQTTLTKGYVISLYESADWVKIRVSRTHKLALCTVNALTFASGTKAIVMHYTKNWNSKEKTKSSCFHSFFVLLIRRKKWPWYCNTSWFYGCGFTNICLIWQVILFVSIV